MDTSKEVSVTLKVALANPSKKSFKKVSKKLGS
jgi:hypothetical protein